MNRLRHAGLNRSRIQKSATKMLSLWPFEMMAVLLDLTIWTLSNYQWKLLRHGFKVCMNTLCCVENRFQGPISVQGRDFINKMTFQIWLPRYEDVRNSEADERMKQAILDNVPKIRSMEGTNRLQKLKLTIPKFSIDFDEDVKELMSKNGLDQMFRQGFSVF